MALVIQLKHSRERAVSCARLPALTIWFLQAPSAFL